MYYLVLKTHISLSFVWICRLEKFLLVCLLFDNLKLINQFLFVYLFFCTKLIRVALIFLQVLIRFLPVTSERCLVEPWCRELGFVVCYGAVVLKLYRHLIEFRTRKAHRWVIRDTDLLKYLAAMVSRKQKNKKPLDL